MARKSKKENAGCFLGKINLAKRRATAISVAVPIAQPLEKSASPII